MESEASDKVLRKAIGKDGHRHKKKKRIIFYEYNKRRVNHEMLTREMHKAYKKKYLWRDKDIVSGKGERLEKKKKQTESKIREKKKQSQNKNKKWR